MWHGRLYLTSFILNDSGIPNSYTMFLVLILRRHGHAPSRYGSVDSVGLQNEGLRVLF